jgi:plasmid stability protein
LAEASKKFALHLKASVHHKIAARAAARGLSKAGWVRSVIMDALGPESRGVGHSLAELRRLDRSLRQLGSALQQDSAADLARALTLAKVPE